MFKISANLNGRTISGEFSGFPREWMGKSSNAMYLVENDGYKVISAFCTDLSTGELYLSGYQKYATEGNFLRVYATESEAQETFTKLTKCLELLREKYNAEFGVDEIFKAQVEAVKQVLRLCESGESMKLPSNKEMIQNPEETVRIALDWAAANPEIKPKTYKEDFLEKFPNNTFDADFTYDYCRKMYYGNCECAGLSCPECWDKPMEVTK